jgi:hypothetical protein
MSGQINNGYAFYPIASINVPTGMTIINAYNGFFVAPTTGTGSNVALGADNLAIGYNGYTPPTNGALFEGNVAIGQSSATTALDVYGTTRTTGKAPVSETVTSSTALSTSLDSLVDARAGALTVTLADASNVDQCKLVRLLHKSSMPSVVSCSRGSFNLTASEAARKLRFFADGWAVDEAISNAVPTSFYPTAQAAAQTTFTGSATGSSIGYAIAISADGLTAAVGGYADDTNVGAVWVFTRTDASSTWTLQQAKLVGTVFRGPAMQGYSVALSADGNTLAVGCKADNSNAGSVIIWIRSSHGVWTQQGSALVGSGNTGAAQQGTSVALSADGNTLAVGGPKNRSNEGAVWIWTRSGSTWTAYGSNPIIGSNHTGPAEMGTSVALSADGKTLAFGGPHNNHAVGAVWVWLNTAGTWAAQQSTILGTGNTGAAHVGNSIALSADGNTLAFGGYQDNSVAGAVWIYARSAATWTIQGAKLVGTGATGAAAQGTSIALSDDGNTLISGGSADDSSKGAIWVFVRSAGTIWAQQGSKLTATGVAASDQVGCAVASGAHGQVVLAGGLGKNSSTGEFIQFS